MDTFKKLGPVIAVLVAAFTLFFFVDARYAPAGFVLRVERKWDSDRIRELQRQIWDLDDEYGRGCQRCPKKEKDDYREYQQEVEEIKERLKQNK